MDPPGPPGPSKPDTPERHVPYKMPDVEAQAADPPLITGHPDVQNTPVPLPAYTPLPAPTPENVAGNAHPSTVLAEVKSSPKQIRSNTIRTARRRQKDQACKKYWKGYYLSAAQGNEEPGQSIGKHSLSENEDSEDEKKKPRPFSKSKRRKLEKLVPQYAEAHNVVSSMAVPASGIDARAAMGKVETHENLPDTDKKKEFFRQTKQKIPKSDREARRDVSLLEEATVSFGMQAVKLEVDETRSSMRFLLPGMKTRFYPHQLLGIRFALGREFSPSGPYGGLLGDEMGLGKTVQILAVLTQNRAKIGSARKSTLIVVPNQLMTQWQQEVLTHVDDCYLAPATIYKTGSTLTKENLEATDIVITNYHQVQRQLAPREVVEDAEERRRKGKKDWDVELRKKSRCLFNVDWFRIVLDEAHHIKNYKSQTSTACTYLKGKYRWALTATPAVNTLKEFYPYLKFTNTRFDTRDKFNEELDKKNDPQSSERLSEVLKVICLGRLITDNFAGKPILDIPLCHPTKEHMVSFDAEERGIYAQIEEDIKTSIRAGEKSPVLALYLQLRLMTAHAGLVKAGYCGTHQLENSLIEQSSALFCKACRRCLFKPHRGACGCAFCGLCARRAMGTRSPPTCLVHGVVLSGCQVANDLPDLSFRHGKKILRIRRAGDDENGYQPARLAPHQKGQQWEYPKEHMQKPSKNGARLTQRAGERSKGGTAATGQNDRKRAGKGTRKAQKKKNRDSGPKGAIMEFLKRIDQNPWARVPHSAKSLELVRLIRKWQQDAPDEKIIIFFQWVATMSIIGRILFQEMITFVYYEGGMTGEAIKSSLETFGSNPGIKAMLVSIQAGGFGLNLTMAPRAICFDLWWNSSLEHQAFGRIHRIGQTKEVHTAKLIVRGSIDEGILELQKTKYANIKRALVGAKERKEPTFKDITELLWPGRTVMGRLSEDSDDESEEEPSDDESDSDKEDSDEEWGLPEMGEAHRARGDTPDDFYDMVKGGDSTQPHSPDGSEYDGGEGEGDDSD